MSVQEGIVCLQKEMENEGIIPENGLGSELFLFSSTLAPVVNVDLLVINEKHEILLAWRDDAHTGTGWHIPGGCIRFKETLEERIQKTALQEFGSKVIYNPEILKVFEIFTHHNREKLENQRERAHFITLAYGCYFPETFSLEKNNKKRGEVGFLKWFSELPEDLLEVQKCYQENWKHIEKKLWR